MKVNAETIVQTTIERYERHMNPAIAKLFRLMGLSTVEWKGEGVYIYDIDGKRYLDCLGGYGVFSLGHSCREIVDAVKAQLERMPLSGKIFFNAQMAELGERLSYILPGQLPYSFFVNSGAEAVEGAIKTARIRTGRTKIVAMTGAFHGKTLGALSATGRALFRAPFEPLLAGFVHIPFNDIDAAEAEVDETTAAVLVEPIQGEGGIVVPATGYLCALREIASRKGALLVCDEVQTGLGRTGRLFACEYDTIVPDLIVTAKALGGGVMPIGAFSASARVWEPWIEHPFLHTTTFGGNPLACAAAIKTIEILQRDYSSFEVERKGQYFLNGLCGLRERFPEIIQDVRGRGLMIGIELEAEGFGGFLMAECLKRGVLAAYTLNNPRVIRLEPPFVISYDEIDFVLRTLEEILMKTDWRDIL